MGTIIIQCDKKEDLYFLNELARRLNLRTDINIDDSLGQINTAKSIIEGIKSGMQDVKDIESGKQEALTLDEVFADED